MTASKSEPTYTVWGADQLPYGPVDLPTLVSWIKDERVTAATWLFLSNADAWYRASELPELQMFFHAKASPGKAASSASSVKGIDPRALRRVKVLGAMTDAQLERFAQFMEIERTPQWAHVVRQGDPGDAMYMILEGEFRVRTIIAGRETILATLGVGDFFGDISLFDRGPRSADVIANTNGLLLKIGFQAFEQLSQEEPELASGLLLAVGRTLSARIRTDNKRLGSTAKFAGPTI